MPDRHYSDEDVQRILAAAAESDAAAGTTAPTERGMTLAEIQRVGAEAGINPTAVAAAAAAIDVTPATATGQRVLGFPVGVAQSVPLPRSLDDVEWRKLVALLRDTFDARGREEQGASRREWRNGNLRVAIESFGETALLQMRTRKENARALMRGGVTMLLGSGVVAAALAAAHGNPHGYVGVLMFAFGGLAMSAVGALQLPAWASSRRKQFASVAEYVQRVASVDASSPGKLAPGGEATGDV